MSMDAIIKQRSSTTIMIGLVRTSGLRGGKGGLRTGVVDAVDAVWARSYCGENISGTHAPEHVCIPREHPVVGRASSLFLACRGCSD